MIGNLIFITFLVILFSALIVIGIINFYKVKSELRLMYLLDKDFRNYIIAFKYCIWLSLIWLILDTTIRIVGYY